ncbi:D-glycero-beta-D-manno-heptose 1,7-bisphosphate 7-phosphatase [Niveibacterium umoris]|uniref:D,D-heptose 1,7-bisphosphate phosphatase n=1 Tax=Niveibacterium umoris TaxID=1193620 RepID=A0A840BIM2_9RHOO|nr:D-glycero-beta-D-manno-heptose 1,7-bisphosphate 7-phosphatase [Niveibacterium umoris]MBB4012184.1 D-glycero-D-manno-heptose 1,7-bisphosphate phosphatase [Niveibacterium umoris]
MKLVILDRDGVINFDSAQFIKSPEEWRPIPGSLEAIARFNEAGWRVVVASNQSGVGRGLFDMDTLNAIHEKMTKLLALAGGRIDAIFFCPHPADSTCDCRKPRAGMLREIASRFNVDLTSVPTVGDSLRDLLAGQEVGCELFLVLTGKGERTAAAPGVPEGTRIFPDLAAVADALIK